MQPKQNHSCLSAASTKNTTELQPSPELQPQGVNMPRITCRKCGRDKFYLIQDSINVKLHCANCEKLDIIMWNRESNDKSYGSMRDLETWQWNKK